MSAPHIILDNLPSLCQKLSDLVEVWHSYIKNNFACFLRHDVQLKSFIRRRYCRTGWARKISYKLLFISSTKYWWIIQIHISQGSVATQLRCGVCSNHRHGQMDADFHSFRTTDDDSERFIISANRAAEIICASGNSHSESEARYRFDMFREIRRQIGWCFWVMDGWMDG